MSNTVLNNSAHNKLHDAMKQYRELEKELSLLISNRQTLDSQLKENEAVLAELKIVKEGAEDCIFKMIGSVLIPQEKSEAISNVSKRIDFIKSEIKKIESKITEKQSNVELKQKSLGQLEDSYQQMMISNQK